MKHKLTITLIILAMFIATQFIGLYVVAHYSQPGVELPYGMDVPEVEQERDFYTSFLPSLIFAFVFAIVIIFLLTKYKVKLVLKVWFLIVVVIALSLAINSFIDDVKYSALIALAIAIPLAVLKIYQRNFLIHNATELLIYPGIAAVFVSFLNVWTIIILLVLISGYDMWAVWHSGVMQKMAKYQIDNLKIFSGFFIPYASKKVRDKIKLWKRTLSKKALMKKKIRVNVAMLGGGDVVFPIITAGVMLKYFGFFSSLAVIIGALVGLTFLMLIGKKKKFYPAMPFITTGIFLGMLVWWGITLL